MSTDLPQYVQASMPELVRATAAATAAAMQKDTNPYSGNMRNVKIK